MAGREYGFRERLKTNYMVHEKYTASFIRLCNQDDIDYEKSND